VEADERIDQLKRAEVLAPHDVVQTAPANVPPRPLRELPTDVLVAELRARGWEAIRRCPVVVRLFELIAAEIDRGIEDIETAAAQPRGRGVRGEV